MSRLRRLAQANIGLHLLGLLLAALFMRQGSPGVPLGDRMAYLATRPAGWLLAWTVWIACMIAMVSFTALVSNRMRGNSAARLAMAIAIAAGAFDLLGDCTFIIVIPYIASFSPANEQLFLAAERCTLTLSLVVANGLYSVATLLLTWAARPQLSRATVALGTATFAFGMLLAGAAFTAVPWHAEAATVPTIGAYCLWVWRTAREIDAR